MSVMMAIFDIQNDNKLYVAISSSLFCFQLRQNIEAYWGSKIYEQLDIQKEKSFDSVP